MTKIKMLFQAWRKRRADRKQLIQAVEVLRQHEEAMQRVLLSMYIHQQRKEAQK